MRGPRIGIAEVLRIRDLVHAGPIIDQVQRQCEAFRIAKVEGAAPVTRIIKRIRSPAARRGREVDHRDRTQRASRQVDNRRTRGILPDHARRCGKHVSRGRVVRQDHPARCRTGIGDDNRTGAAPRSEAEPAAIVDRHQRHGDRSLGPLGTKAERILGAPIADRGRIIEVVARHDKPRHDNRKGRGVMRVGGGTSKPHQRAVAPHQGQPIHIIGSNGPPQNRHIAGHLVQ